MMANLKNWSLWTLLVINYHTTGIKSDVTVFPNAINVIEWDNATVRCKYDGENNIQGGFFFLDKENVASVNVRNCTINSLDLDRYKMDCDGDKTLVLTLVNVSRTDHNKRISCQVITNSIKDSTNSAKLLVIVPIERVTISSNYTENDVVSLCEKTPFSIQCETSPARPAPNITWTYEDTPLMEEINTVKNVSKLDNDLFITSSILIVTANRSLNSWYIFCSARNIDGKVGSNKISFNISYPPDQPPSIINVNVTHGDTYIIIEGRHGELICAVPTSNPNAKLSWNNQTNIQSYAQNLVTSKLEWVASRQGREISTCIAEHHCDRYKKAISITINVLYPPKVSGMKNINIIEGSMLNKSCNYTLGKPESATVKWTRENSHLVSDTHLLMIKNISRDSSATYTCTVTNIMKPTCGIDEKGQSNSSFNIDVLYPPTINSMENITVIEGTDYNLRCPFEPGNPNNTKFSWISSDNITYSVTDILSFSNVSRKHDKIYTCTVSNIMKPTDSNEVKGTNSESFRLRIEYPPTVNIMMNVTMIEDSTTVEKFVIEGHDSDVNITIEEHEHVKFICNASSEPISLTDIRFQNGGTLTSTISNDVTYSLGPAKCLDAGMYQCSGRNKHNQINSTLQLTLFVRCSPRAHPFHRIKSNITTALNSQIVMQFSVLAFPLPDIVIWQKLNGHNWINITTSNKTQIKQSEISFNLTINNVEMSDIGKYRLFISNNIGNVTQDYRIISAEQVEYTDEQAPEGNITGIVIGVVCGIIGVIVPAIIIIIFLKRRSWLKCQKKSTNSVTNLPNQYESLDGIQKDSNHYSELQEVHKRHKDSNIDRMSLAGSEPVEIDHEKPIYINMTL